MTVKTCKASTLIFFGTGVVGSFLGLTVGGASVPACEASAVEAPGTTAAALSALGDATPLAAPLAPLTAPSVEAELELDEALLELDAAPLEAVASPLLPESETLDVEALELDLSPVAASLEPDDASVPGPGFAGSNSCRTSELALTPRLARLFGERASTTDSK